MSILEIPKLLCSFGKRDSILFRFSLLNDYASVACVLEIVWICYGTKTKQCRENGLFVAMVSYWGHKSSYSRSDRRSLPSRVLALTVSNSKYLKQRDQCQDLVVLPLCCALEAILWLWEFLAIDFYYFFKVTSDRFFFSLSNFSKWFRSLSKLLVSTAFCGNNSLL